MRLHTSPLTTVETATSRRYGTLEQHFALFGGMAFLLTLALVLPGMAQPAHYHAFADQRGWGALPHAADVLSNLGFVIAGLAGLVVLWRADRYRLCATARALCALFFAGLLCSGAGSTFYHWAPQDASLAWDRLGMSVAFAGLLGLAVQSRVDDTCGWLAAAALLVAAPLSIAVWRVTGNMLPWAVLQAGGMLLVVALAWLPARAGALPLSLGMVIALYALAKLLELSDLDIFVASGDLVSGHSLKHLAAAFAAWPVLRALLARQRR